MRMRICKNCGISFYGKNEKLCPICRKPKDKRMIKFRRRLRSKASNTKNSEA